MAGIMFFFFSATKMRSRITLSAMSTQKIIPSVNMSAMWLAEVPEAEPKYKTVSVFFSGKFFNNVKTKIGIFYISLSITLARRLTPSIIRS